MIHLLNTSDCIGLLETHADKSVDKSLPGYHVFVMIELNIKMRANLQQGLSIQRVNNLYHKLCSKIVVGQCVLIIPSKIAGSWFTSGQ